MNALRFSSLLLAAIALASAIAALRLGLWSAGTPGPGLFPFLTAAMLLGTSIAAASRDKQEPIDAQSADRGRLLWHGIAISAFAIGFGITGALLTTFAFMVGVLRGIEKLGWVPSLAVAGALALLSWVVFKQLLGVPLPAGLWGIK